MLIQITGTLNILQIARNKNIKVIHTSTSRTYGTAQFVPIAKNPLVAQSPYAASKIAADQLALSFNKSFELPVAVLDLLILMDLAKCSSNNSYNNYTT